MKKPNKKKLALSVVAFVLILMSLVSFTYSWIDDIKLVEFTNDNLADNGAPLKTGTDINATVNITKNENTIDFGNMLETGDISFQYKNGTAQEYNEQDATSPTGVTQHIKYDTNSPNNTKNPDMDDINEKKGYFYESGDMHLSACYGDGEKFYFPVGGQNNVYREGNKDDENVNYISFTAKVSSPYATTDFWFKTVPKIYKHGDTSTTIDNARYAIIVDGQSHIYSKSGSAFTCNNNLDGTTAVQGVRKTTDYTYGHADNTTDDRGANSNTLFSIKRGSTVNLTIKIWIESDNSFDTSITASDINLQLVSSWAYERTITIVDRTTNNKGASWINDQNAVLFATCPEILDEYSKKIYNTDNPNVDNWKNIRTTAGYESAPFYKPELQPKVNESDPDTYTISVPLVFNNEEMILYRCAKAASNPNDDPNVDWNKGSHTGKNGDYGVTYWNWWRTILPNTYKPATYTLYGSSYDEVAAGSDANATYKGYGTWGPVELIEVYSHYGNTDYATYQESTDTDAGSRLYIHDHTDEDTSGEVYTYVMYRGNNDPGTSWKAYVPASSSKIQFVYKLGNAQGTWGYKSWGEENRQMRPLKSTGLYPANSTVYHFAQNYGSDHGWGYWEGAESAYLIKRGYLRAENPPYAYMFDSGKVFFKVNSSWSVDSPRAGAYFYNDNSSRWMSMVKITDDTYYTDVPSGSWSKVIFARLNPANNDLNFNSGTCWNQTGDLDFKNGQVFKLNHDSITDGFWIDFPGGGMSELIDPSKTPVVKHYPTYDAQVYKTSHYNPNNDPNLPYFTDARVFKSIVFSGGSNANQGVNLNLFPGCFYEPGENNTDAGKWLGSLDDSGRDASSSGDSGGSSGGEEPTVEPGTGSMDGYTQPCGFKFKIDGMYYDAKTNGTDFKVRVPLSTGENWTTVQYGDNNTNFGTDESSHYIAGSEFHGLYLTSGKSRNNSIDAVYAGDYIISFKNENENTIYIFKIEREA